jgi:hypothetical protein
MMKFWKKQVTEKKLENLVAVEDQQRGAVFIASTEHQADGGGHIRKRLEKAKLLEAEVNPATAVKVNISTVEGIKYPQDFNDWQDYLDAYYYIPYVARAVDIKQFMIWQTGYTLESDDEQSKQAVTDLLTQVQADTVIRDGTLYGLIFGNMYWQILEGPMFKPLNPLNMGLKLNGDQIAEYVYSPKFGTRITFKPEQIIHLKFNSEPWSTFGVSTLRRVLPTVKNLLFMEEKLPWIARRRADPLLAIQIGSKEQPVDTNTFNRIKTSVLNRKPGEDIFHDGTLQIQEVYQSASVGGRQTVEPILAHFMRNLVAGLGVPEPALGFGGTTTMATAEYQQTILESEVHAFQRALKRLHETAVFPLANAKKDVKLLWRPLTEENREVLSKMLQGEIEHGIVSPSWARQKLGYPEDAGDGAVLDVRFAPCTLSVKPEKKK